MLLWRDISEKLSRSRNMTVKGSWPIFLLGLGLTIINGLVRRLRALTKALLLAVARNRRKPLVKRARHAVFLKLLFS